VILPESISIDASLLTPKSKVSMLGEKGIIKLTDDNDKKIIMIPKKLQQSTNKKYAVVLKITG
jgi:hypothetical protein